MDGINFLNGVSALILICVAGILACLSLYYYFKKDSKMHRLVFLFNFAIAFGWTGITITFLSVAFYGENLPGLESFISYFSYSSIPIGAISVVYMNWDVFGSPKNKKPVMIILLGTTVIYYLGLFLTFNQAIIVSDPVPEVILDDWVNPMSIFYYILWGQVGLGALVTGLGFNKFRKVTAGDLTVRAKYIMTASILGGGGILFDTVILMGPIFGGILWLPRIMMIATVILIHLGYKPSKG